MQSRSTFVRLPQSLLAKGFSLVELLIVIIVIGILATIITVAYSGVTRQTIEVSLQSDLSTALDQLTYNASKGIHPQDASGLVASQGNTLELILKPYGYCLTATNPKTPLVFVAKSSDRKIIEGNCDASGAPYTADLPAGYADGSCDEARFNFSPTTNGTGGEAVWDQAGNMYVADPGNQVIRKITPDCTVSIYAGTLGVAGTVDGPIATARFNYPAAIVIDSDDNLYVGDRGGNRVRKITPDGIVSTYASGVSMGRKGDMAMYHGIIYMSRDGFGTGTITPHSVGRILPDGTVDVLAGSGTAGFADGTGTAAQFSSPYGIDVDPDGNIYVADSINNRIRKITPEGVVTTYAGTGAHSSNDGPALTATFAEPRTIAVDSKGWVYTRGTGYYSSVYNESRLRVITPDGIVKPLWWANSGPGSTTGRRYPLGLAVDKNFNVWTFQSDGASGSGIYKISQ